MSQKFDVCIRGGGIVGSALALLLAQQRLRVALCTAPDAPAAATPQAPAHAAHHTPTPPPTHPSGHSDIRAYALNATSRALLESVRAWPEAATTPHQEPPVTPVVRMEVHGDQGGALSFDAQAGATPPLNWMVDVPALQARLAEALRFQSMVEVFTPPQAAPKAALTVVCEGKRSRTRAEYGLAYTAKHYPHHAVAARLRLPRPHQGVARQWFQGGEIVALLPLGGDAGDTAALVWSVPAAKAQHLMTLSPPDFMAALAQSLPADTLSADPANLTHPPQTWPLELSQAEHWVAPGVALAGDAAHAMHPLAGQGLNMGLGDASELARVLQQREYWRSLGDIKLLRRYERARKAEFAALGGLTDGLFLLFNQDQPLVQSLRNWGMTGVNRLTPLKHWLARQAQGQAHSHQASPTRPAP